MAKGLDISKTAGMLARQLEDAENFRSKRIPSATTDGPSVALVDGDKQPDSEGREGGPEKARQVPPSATATSSRKASPKGSSEDRDWVAPSWKVDKEKARTIDRIFLLMRADGVGHRYKQDLVDEAMDWLIEKHKKYARR
jgi:hypothetical protein